MSDPIIDINTKEALIDIALPTNRDVLYCSCERILLDIHEREVRCRECSKKWDAFDWLVRRANAERSLLSRLEHLEEEQKRRSESLNKLQGEEQRVKGRIASAKRKFLGDAGV